MELSAATTATILPAPRDTVRASVVVPARDEEERIGRCLDALAAQDEMRPEEYEVIVVLDACVDGTAAEVDAVRSSLSGTAQRRRTLRAIHTVDGPGRGAGPARAIGMDIACARLEVAGRRTADCSRRTDADSVVAPDWIARQLEAIAAGRRGDRRRDHPRPDRSRGAAAGGPCRPRGATSPTAPATPPTADQPSTPTSPAPRLGVTPRAYRRVGGMALAGGARGPGARGPTRRRRRRDPPPAPGPGRRPRPAPTAAPSAASPATSSWSLARRRAATPAAISASSDLLAAKSDDGRGDPAGARVRGDDRPDDRAASRRCARRV